MGFDQNPVPLVDIGGRPENHVLGGGGNLTPTGATHSPPSPISFTTAPSSTAKT